MRVLVLNCGSSSVKWRLFDGAAAGNGGLVERVSDHTAALREILDEVSEVAAIGHRMVHGGLSFTAPTLIDDEVVAAVTALIPLAPLHNPPNLAGVKVARELMPSVPQVAVFDTAFHRTIPAANATYAIDAATAAKHGIVRYGFHGTSHAYVSRQTAALLGKDPSDVNVITLHLGNGASACAVKGGRSFATTMGLSPLEGLVMGTRSGDIDPAIVFHLHRVAGMPVDDIDEMLNRNSGLRGLCGDNDMREVIRRRDTGDASAALAFDVYTNRIKQYVGAYFALLGRVDAITFTAGVGENSHPVRAAALSGLEGLGIAVEHNRKGIISPEGATVTVCVIATDEEREIAEQTAALLA